MPEPRDSAPRKRNGSRSRPRRARRPNRRSAKSQQLQKRQKQATVQRKRGGVIGFLSSCVAELKRVQWPDRDTLLQATAVTVVFVFVAAVYLGVIDLVVNWVVQRIL